MKNKSVLVITGVTKTTYEDDDFVDTIDELGREVALNCTHDKLAGLWLHWTVTHVVEVGGTEIGSHYDDGYEIG